MATTLDKIHSTAEHARVPAAATEQETVRRYETRRSAVERISREPDGHLLLEMLGLLADEPDPRRDCACCRKPFVPVHSRQICCSPLCTRRHQNAKRDRSKAAREAKEREAMEREERAGAAPQDGGER